MLLKSDRITYSVTERRATHAPVVVVCLRKDNLTELIPLQDAFQFHFFSFFLDELSSYSKWESLPRVRRKEKIYILSFSFLVEKGTYRELIRNRIEISHFDLLTIISLFLIEETKNDHHMTVTLIRFQPPPWNPIVLWYA